MKKENSIVSAWKRRIRRCMSMQEKRGGEVFSWLSMKTVVTTVVVVFEIEAVGSG
jgi:hypothetical protein